MKRLNKGGLDNEFFFNVLVQDLRIGCFTRNISGPNESVYLYSIKESIIWEVCR